MARWLGEHVWLSLVGPCSQEGPPRGAGSSQPRPGSLGLLASGFGVLARFPELAAAGRGRSRTLSLSSGNPSAQTQVESKSRQP